MHDWNTIFPVNTNKLDEAILALDALIDENTFPFLEVLQEKGAASIFEISLATGGDDCLLECQAELLNRAGLLEKDGDILCPTFSLNYRRLKQVRRMAFALAGASSC
ncbi:MAG: hypothetical protein KDC66_15740 [Phaeodactylibacter sp.]|nr:hypothetical protein [Phaeodactylibacter sp.]MCB9274586.1 hypothetical protein [Lewinellaceae bacterium]